MWVSERSATRNAASARRGFANAHKAAAAAVCFRNPRRSTTIGMLLGVAGDLFYGVQFFLQAGAAARQDDDVQHHDEPGGEEAVEHEGEITCVHLLFLSRQPYEQAGAMNRSRGQSILDGCG